ncbi:hypothetical protein MPSEU_000899400 [Mayamaea pseudoterrestris]|nr:hypothetical protein MPSEU_000899400 [Mayamaea pseudoterrestris]
MLSRTTSSTTFRLVFNKSVRLLSTEASAPASMVNLNFSLPHETIYKNTPVHSVILPGSEGEYGITANHVPYVAQLKPGVVQIIHAAEGGGEAEKYFVCGGYALTHPNSTTDVVCPEGVKLDEIDSAAVSAHYEKAKSAFGAAAAGSVEQAEAQIDMEVNRAMGLAIGLNLS